MIYKSMILRMSREDLEDRLNITGKITKIMMRPDEEDDTCGVVDLVIEEDGWHVMEGCSVPRINLKKNHKVLSFKALIGKRDVDDSSL
jgi:hypothetical protein